MSSASLAGARARAICSATLVCLALTACGGGGDAGPTPLPSSLSIQAPAIGEAGESLRFAQSAGSVEGLTYSWNFGDGSNSTEASPQHSYTKGGDYEVVLTVRNAANESRETRWLVTVNNKAHVRGLECSESGSAGWCWQQPLPTGNPVSQVLFVDASTGWRVGAQGEIFKTGDGGKTWGRQTSGVSSNLLQIYAIDAQRLMVIGEHGALLQSSDGGSNWSVTKIQGSNSPQLRIQHADVNKIVLSDGSYFLSSADGGRTWTSSQYLYNAAVGSDGAVYQLDYSQLNRSLDGGKSFASVLELGTGGGSSARMATLEDRRVVVTRLRSQYVDGKYRHSYQVWRSLDGGTQWGTTEASGLTGQDDYYAPELIALAMSADGLRITASHGGKLVRSLDGGVNWQPVNLPMLDPYGYYSPRAVGGRLLLMAGYSGSFLSADQGQTWQSVTAIGENYDMHSAQWQLLKSGGVQIQVNGKGYLSNDLGKTWVQAYTLPQESYEEFKRKRLSFVDARHGWMLNTMGQPLQTVDGGRTWTALPTLAPSFGVSLQMLDTSKGWLLDRGGNLATTSDGGKSWTKVSTTSLGIDSFNFESATLGWARGYNNHLLVTRDGGSSWALVSTPFPAQEATDRWQPLGDHWLRSRSELRRRRAHLDRGLHGLLIRVARSDAGRSANRPGLRGIRHASAQRRRRPDLAQDQPGHAIQLEWCEVR